MPSLDPFLLKDAFQREGIAINESYFQISAETWAEIEAFMLQQFEPLVKAAFPDAMSSDERARALMDTDMGGPGRRGIEAADRRIETAALQGA